MRAYTTAGPAGPMDSYVVFSDVGAPDRSLVGGFGCLQSVSQALYHSIQSAYSKKTLKTSIEQHAYAYG